MRKTLIITTLMLLLVSSVSAQEGSKAPEHTPIPLVDVDNPIDRAARGSINKPLIVEQAPSDPTTLTTQQLYREVMLMRQELDRIGVLSSKINETRFNAMDKALQLLQAASNRQPSVEAVDLKVEGLDKIASEKFKKVETQIAERDIQVQQNAAVVAKAVTDALQAAKEAVSEQNKSNATAMLKSEAGVTKQIDQLQLLASQTTKSTDEKIEDMKLRNNILETRIGAMENHDKGSSDMWGYIMAAITAVISICGILGISFMRRASATNVQMPPTVTHRHRVRIRKDGTKEIIE